MSDWDDRAKAIRDSAPPPDYTPLDDRPYYPTDEVRNFIASKIEQMTQNKTLKITNETMFNFHSCACAAIAELRAKGLIPSIKAHVVHCGDGQIDIHFSYQR